MPLRIAVLIKQVPRFESMTLGEDGRLQRDGLDLEINPYCRRAVTKGVELARLSGGTATAFTLGPPAAEDALREAVAAGADAGILITDPAFAGSDTLATARALTAALTKEGPFDLILSGRNSVDADTGQVGPEVAQLLGLAFLGGVRELSVEAATGRIAARCEYDDGWISAETSVPAVISCAERLCEPAKVDPAGRASVPASRLRTLVAADLGPGPWGQAASPTVVGDVRLLASDRQRAVLDGPLAAQVNEAVRLMADRGALDFSETAGTLSNGVGEVPPSHPLGAPAAPTAPLVAVVIEPGRPRLAQELLGAAAQLAAEIRGLVVALVSEAIDGRLLQAWGTDALVHLRGTRVEEDVAFGVSDWCRRMTPWAVIAPGTMWGREVTGRSAATLGAGLTGDAVDLNVRDGRLVGWKPAFGGRLVAAITATSEIQLVTVRPGVLPLRRPRPPNRGLDVEDLVVAARDRVRHLDGDRDDDIGRLATATAVVGLGMGIRPEEYEELDALIKTLGAELAATRKVTDAGWLPRARQVGITGQSIAPRLYVAIGLSGKFNHMVGVRGAGEVLAINQDPHALVFDECDVGIVGDWHEVVPLLTAELARRS